MAFSKIVQPEFCYLARRANGNQRVVPTTGVTNLLFLKLNHPHVLGNAVVGAILSHLDFHFFARSMRRTTEFFLRELGVLRAKLIWEREDARLYHFAYPIFAIAAVELRATRKT